MNFKGKANPLSQQGLDTACQLLGTGPAEIWTLLTVETKGCGYLPDRRPVILFERHIFHKQTGGAHGSPEPGGYFGGAKEYDRLEEAMALDEDVPEDTMDDLQPDEEGMAKVTSRQSFS